jgi:hypothetical protein
MPVYSFIMDFRGGTYISQTTAPNLNKSVELWAKNLNTEILYLGDKSKKQLIADIPELIDEEEFVNIDTMKNIWFGMYRFKTGLAKIHIIKTDIAS